MNANLNLFLSIQAFTDPTVTSNPKKRIPDLNKSLQGLAIQDPRGDTFSLDPQQSLSIFDGSRTTSIDNTTEFTLSLSTLASNRYRFTHTNGTAPVFRTDRALTANGSNITIVVNTNNTITLTSDNSDFGSVVVGDNVFIPGPTTGDSATVFAASNEGLWVVLSASATVLELSRPTGTGFQASAETVLLTSNAQLQAFSAAGVQVGDTVNIASGFASVVLRAYEIAAIHPSWFEVLSTAALPVSAVGIPGAANIAFYQFAKRLVYIEGDQQFLVQINGDTSSFQKVQPWLDGDEDLVGQHLHTGTVWSLTIENLSDSPLNLLVISVG